MPAQTPTGPLAVPMEALARLVASSATFQSILGAANPGFAINKVYYQEASDAVSGGVMIEPRPRAIVYTPEGWSMTREGVASWRSDGTLMLQFEFIVPAQWRSDRREEALWFTNQIGAILTEMRNASGSNDPTYGAYLNVNRFELTNGPGPCELSEEFEEFWGAEFAVRWV